MFEFLPQQAGLKRSRGNKRFSPYEVSRRSASSMTWTHKFVCLSDCSHDEVPNVSDKFKLKCAGLGEKKIVFRLDGKYAELKETLFRAYPALEKGGGFELMRTAAPYSRHLMPISAQFTTSVSNLKQFIDQARIYIRPIQADLPLQEEDDNKEGNVGLHWLMSH